MFQIDVKNVTLITVVVLALMMLISGLTFNNTFEEPRVVFLEEPIAKNSRLQIESGDEFVYSYMMENNQTINITYIAIQDSGCMRIFIDESVNNTNICVDEWGVDESGSNATFKDPSFLLFKPWMLALDEGWRWNNSMYMELGDIRNHIADNSLRVMRVEEYKNRTAYVVELSTSTGSKEYQWVDAEKRIMLKSLGQGYQVELVDN